MGAKTGIQWTDRTFNPWLGCAHVSPGCVNCYAERDAERYGWDVWGARSPRHVTSDSYWRQPLKWNREAERDGRRQRVFCASMADVFEPRADLEPWRAKLWMLIDATPWLDWQLLTKRPEEVAGMAPWGDDWPTNVWLGTSVENQEWADKRIPTLLMTPARLRFLSCEPLVGPVDLRKLTARNGAWIDCLAGDVIDPRDGVIYAAAPHSVEWVIVGGESGPGHRRMDFDWARDLVAQCERASVPVFVKQLGAAYRQRGDSHGADMAYWPEELRVRQMPASVP